MCTSRMLIEVSKVQGGVFLHKVAPDEMKQVHFVRASEPSYGHLGHPSREVISLPAKILYIKDNVENKTKECSDVCLHAKQTRCPFTKC